MRRVPFQKTGELPTVPTEHTAGKPATPRRLVEPELVSTRGRGRWGGGRPFLDLGAGAQPMPHPEEPGPRPLSRHSRPKAGPGCSVCPAPRGARRRALLSAAQARGLGLGRGRGLAGPAWSSPDPCWPPAAKAGCSGLAAPRPEFLHAQGSTTPFCFAK